MTERSRGGPNLDTMRAMGLVVEGGGFEGVRSISVCSPNNTECQTVRVQPITIAEYQNGYRTISTVLKPSHSDLERLRAEMGF